MSIISMHPGIVAQISASNEQPKATRFSFAAITKQVRNVVHHFMAPSFGEQRYKDSDFFATSRWEGYGRNGVTWDGMGWRI